MTNDCRVRRFAATLLGALLLCVPARARAQDARADGPYRGLFGGADSKATRQLDLTWSLLDALDGNVAADAQSPVDPQFQVKGTYGVAQAGLKFGAYGKHTTFGLTAASDARYYPGLHSLNAYDGSGGVNFGADLGPRAKLQLTEGFTYQPYYQLNFLGDLAPADSTAPRSSSTALTSNTSYGSDGSVGLVEQLTERSSLTFNYSYRYTQFSAGAERFSWQLAQAHFSRHLTRYAALRLGYGYGRSQYTSQPGAPTESHDIDVGIDYSRPLAFSRRTTLSFSSGSTIVRQPLGRPDYFVTGDANLTRQIGRTWSSTLSYHRGVQFLEGFTQPLFADTATLRAGGLLARRLAFNVSGGYSAGHLESTAGRQRYATYTAASDLRWAIGRVLSAYVEYTSYRYAFDSGVAVPFDVPGQLSRQSVRVGVSGWLPVFRSKGGTF